MISDFWLLKICCTASFTTSQSSIICNNLQMTLLWRDVWRGTRRRNIGAQSREDWCEKSHLKLNLVKTKIVTLGWEKNRIHCDPVCIRWIQCDKLDRSTNTTAILKTAMSWHYFFRQFRTLNIKHKKILHDFLSRTYTIMSNIKLFWPGLPPLAALAPPRIIDNYPAYTTLRLLEVSRKEKGPQYLVDWKQFGPEEHCWVSNHHNLDCHLVWESHIQHADLADVTLPIQLTCLSLPPHRMSVGVDCLREVWWSWSMPSSALTSSFWLESSS